MHETDINKMDFKGLKKEVQQLRDDLARMKRSYEDILYNIDTDNFSEAFIKENNETKTLVKITADGIKTKVSKAELENAQKELSTEIDQRADAITLSVSAIDGKVSALESDINITAEGILSTVSEVYQTKDDANNEYITIEENISTISQKADEIQTTVESVIGGNKSIFTQTAEGFTLDGEKTTFTGVIYLTDNVGDKRFSFFLDENVGATQIIMHSCTSEMIPVTIGDEDGEVYIGQASSGNEVATRNWVLEQNIGGGGTAVAVFG